MHQIGYKLQINLLPQWPWHKYVIEVGGDYPALCILASLFGQGARIPV